MIKMNKTKNAHINLRIDKDEQNHTPIHNPIHAHKYPRLARDNKHTHTQQNECIHVKTMHVYTTHACNKMHAYMHTHACNKMHAYTHTHAKPINLHAYTHTHAKPINLHAYTHTHAKPTYPHVTKCMHTHTHALALPIYTYITLKQT
jgi:hypothetical protein